MGETAGEPPAIFSFAFDSVKDKAAAGAGFRAVRFPESESVADVARLKLPGTPDNA
jgi:hypothetical protein